MISRKQLLVAGVARSSISRWLLAARLHRVHPGVYALGHAALSLDGRLIAALLYGGHQAVLSHTTAAWVWGLIDAQPTRIHLTTSRRRSSLPGVRVHRSRQVEVVEQHGFAVTSVARTLVDLASIVSPRQVRRAVAEADYLDLLDSVELRSSLGKGRTGSRALRAALDAHLPQLAQTLSVLEETFLELCRNARIQLPEVNAKVGRMRVDALWREERLVVELDGAAAHGTRSAVTRDRERELALRRLGFRVVRYAWRQITQRPADVIADLRQQLGLVATG
jgi:very-short-patch-repair endonuclease